MDTFYYYYIAAWSSACILAAAIYLKDHNSFSISSSSYRHFLWARWKIVTFIIATVGIVFVAPYAGDPTWDYFDALFMAVLTFASAPWTIGTLYQTIRRQTPIKHAYVALCLWMFSASWSYDLYLVLRDGYYPITWFSNILASSILYITAGLLWNLEWRPNRGVTFSFMEENWPSSPSIDSSFGKLVWFALPFMALTATAILYFVLPLN